MSSNIVNSSALLDAVRQKAAEAAGLMERMGSDPSPSPEDMLDRLAVSLERRRAAVAVAVADWRQGRDRLAAAVDEASAVHLESSVSALCQAEVKLDAAIGDNRLGQIFWDSRDAEATADEVIQLIEAIKFGLPTVFQLATDASRSANEFMNQEEDRKRDETGSTSADNKGDVNCAARGTVGTVSRAACDALVNARHLRFQGVAKIQSATSCWKRFYCIDSISGEILVRDSIGLVATESVTCSSTNRSRSNAVSNLRVPTHPIRLGCGDNNKSSLIIVYPRCVILTDANGVSRFSIGPNFSVNYNLASPQDAISADKVVVIASPSFGLYLVSLDSPKTCKASLPSGPLGLVCPVRLAWDHVGQLLFVLDKVRQGAYRVCKFKIGISQRTLESAGAASAVFESDTNAPTPSMIAVSNKIFVCLFPPHLNSTQLLILNASNLSRGARHVYLTSISRTVVDLCCLGDGSLTLSYFCTDGSFVVANHGTE